MGPDEELERSGSLPISSHSHAEGESSSTTSRGEMESEEALRSLLPERVEEQRAREFGSSGSYRTAGKRVVAFLVLCLVVAAVSFTAGQRQQRRDDKEREGDEDEDRWGPSRELRKLKRPTVILISSDGFRWGYNYKVATPNIERLSLNGTEAATGLIPVFPSLTFPNHYSIATGLYPSWHGVIGNKFSDPEYKDPKGFNMGNIDPKWWGGEPIWVTVTKAGLRAATYFWAGSEVPKGPWTCEPKFCKHYNGSVPFEDRVDEVLGYMDLPLEDIPSFISLYFESPDHEGHLAGPDSPEVASAVQEIDSLIGRLIVGLEARDLFDDVTIILVGDHGMVSTCDAKMVYLEDLDLGSGLKVEWVDSFSALLAIRPPQDVDPNALYLNMSEALASGKVKNSDHLKLYLKEDLPKRFLYSENDRIQPIVGLLSEGYKVGWSRAKSCGAQCGGQHGYDNHLLSMRTIFIAHGPQFAEGRSVPSFHNVEIYNVLAKVLGLTSPAPNNGSAHFASSLLRPRGL